MWKRAQTARPRLKLHKKVVSTRPTFERFASQILSICAALGIADAANHWKTPGILSSFMQVAYVDPSDPSVLYLSQPTAVAGSEERCSFSVSEKHLHVRNSNQKQFRQHCAANRKLKIVFTWFQRSEPTLRLMLPPHLQPMVQARS